MTFLFISLNFFAQNSNDNFVGTWIYQKNDTTFRIKLQRGVMVTSLKKYNTFFGGYQLIVKGKMVEDYIKSMPQTYHSKKGIEMTSAYIYIYGVQASTNLVGFSFYDQRIKHAKGRGLLGCKMELISQNKLHWLLDEKAGLWWAYEGGEEDIPALQGFSVPSDVIMTKEE